MDNQMIPPRLDQRRLAEEIGGWVTDDRVPRPFEWDGGDASYLGHWRRQGASCPAGRHTWDAIVVERDTYDEAVVAAFGSNPDREVIEFRLVLTCTQCGIIEKLSGYRDPQRGTDGEIDPVPLRAGGLVAQEVSRTSMSFGGPLSTWLVHDSAGAAVGKMSWGSTPRGRRYVSGRLVAWPSGLLVEAPTAVGCLRKMAKFDQVPS